MTEVSFGLVRVTGVENYLNVFLWWFLPELEALKERFLKHSMHKVKAAAEKKVNLHIVRKERTEDGKEELKTDVVPVTIEAENLEEKIVKPGNLKEW